MPHQLRQYLLTAIQAFPPVPHFRVAFSGGLDSSVLLHLMACIRGELGAELSALHIDHRLSPHSADWSDHCVRFCETLNVPITVERVTVSGTRDKGLEAAARQARYTAFESVLGEGDMLLTAHHRDDQAETLLLQLFRGGGDHGLASMPTQRPLGSGWLGRPLLEVGREALLAYARSHGLEWIDDPSNFDTSLDRNYLRHTLLPQLNERRAGIRDILARSAGHFAESAQLLDELAAMDRQEARVGESTLSISVLRNLSPQRCRNLLRYHLRQLDLPPPQHTHLHRIMDEVMHAVEDAMPLVTWPGVEVRRYRDRLYFMPNLMALPPSPVVIPWDNESAMALPHGLGRIQAEPMIGRGIFPASLDGRRCELRLRIGGEKLQPAGREGHHTLKKLYQEQGVPPWERERRPLLYVDGRLAQVAGLWTAQEFAVAPDEEGIMLQWSSSAIEKKE